MDDGDRETLIRERAYAIWLEAGRPDGQADAHWQEACDALDAEDAAVTPLHNGAADPAPLIPPNR